MNRKEEIWKHINECPFAWIMMTNWMEVTGKTIEEYIDEQERWNSIQC